jgi:hypothetical protein
MTMAVLLRLSYELGKPKRGNPGPDVSTNIAALTPQEKEWARKAVERYGEAQEHKWRRWNEAMFEAKQS